MSLIEKNKTKQKQVRKTALQTKLDSLMLHLLVKVVIASRCLRKQHATQAVNKLSIFQTEISN